MDITKPDWENRYNAALASMGIDPAKYVAKLHPAIEAFYKGEVELFDVSLEDFTAQHPKLEKQVQDLRARIADPFVDTTCLKGLNLVLLRKRVASGKEHLAQSETMVSGVPYVTTNIRELMDTRRHIQQN